MVYRNPSSVDTLVVGHQRVSYCDWPSKISTILFTSGCDLYCPTCHNLSIAHPTTPLTLLNLDDIFSYIHEKKAWLDGIVISGGEPLIHDKLKDLCFLLKAFDLPIKLDTNGMYPDHLGELLGMGYIDTVAVDIKATYDLYPEVTGRNNITPEEFKQRIESTIQTTLTYPDINLYFRTTLVPLINNDDTLNTLKAYIPDGYQHRLQAYVAPV